MRYLLSGLLLLPLSALARDAREKIRPEDPAPWQTRPMDVRADVVRTLLAQGSADRALELLAAFRAEGVESPELTLLQGIALRETGMGDAAERVLLEAKSGLGRDARPSAELCVLYADQQRLEAATDACDRAVALDRSNPRAWNNYGWLLLASNRPTEAVDAFDEAIDLDSSEERYRNNLGFALVALDRIDDAERAFRASGSHADSAYNVGVALQQAGRGAEAGAWFKSALAYDPAHGPARDALAAAHESVSPPEESP